MESSPIKGRGRRAALVYSRYQANGWREIGLVSGRAGQATGAPRAGPA